MRPEFTVEEPDYPALDAVWTPHLQALHRYFLETAADACLLWVDPAQGDPFAGNPLVEERRMRVPISHPRFDLQFAPYLVPLNLQHSADADLFRLSVQMAWQAWQPENLAAALGQPVSGWIRTGVDATLLAQYWARACHLHMHGGLNKLLRFHDPGVREWLWPALDEAQKTLLLGPAQAVVSFSRARQLQYHESLAPDRPPALSRLILTAAQWSQVDDYATLHAALLAAHTSHASGIDARAVLGALTHATRYNVVDAQDRVLFASHALAFGPEFHTDERLKGVWKLTAEGEFYGGAVEEVTGVPADELAPYLAQRVNI